MPSDTPLSLLPPVIPSYRLSTESSDWATLMDHFLSGLTPSTQRAYRYSVERFVAWLKFDPKTEMLKALDAIFSMHPGRANEVMLAYSTYLSLEVKSRDGAPLSPASINSYTAGIRALAKMYRLCGRISWSFEIRQKKVQPYRDVRGPGIANIAKLLDAANRDASPARCARDHAMLALQFTLALRRSSLESLDISDLDLNSKTIWIREKGKTQKRKFDLSDDTISALKRWLSFRQNSAGPLFVRIRSGSILTDERLRADGYARRLKQIAIAAGINGPIRSHGIRHTAILESAKTAIQERRGLSAVMALSGHANPNTLRAYLDIEEGIQKHLSSDLASRVSRMRTAPLSP